MSLPQAVAAYIDARAAADSAPVWARLSCEDEAAHRMRELLAACFGASVALDDALIAHAPDFVRAQAERWQGMAGLLAPVKEPEPIVVLGPWRQHPSGTWYRLHHGTKNEGATVKHGEWALRPNLPDVWPAIVRGDGDKDDADREARARGWVLLDAEPHTQPVALDPWRTEDGVRRRYGIIHSWSGRATTVLGIAVSDVGWRVKGRLGWRSSWAAHGPQTGPEGERLAMAAALALGFVEGAQ